MELHNTYPPFYWTDQHVPPSTFSWCFAPVIGCSSIMDIASRYVFKTCWTFSVSTRTQCTPGTGYCWFGDFSKTRISLSKGVKLHCHLLVKFHEIYVNVMSNFLDKEAAVTSTTKNFAEKRQMSTRAGLCVICLYFWKFSNKCKLPNDDASVKNLNIWLLWLQSTIWKSVVYNANWKFFAA